MTCLPTIGGGRRCGCGAMNRRAEKTCQTPVPHPPPTGTTGRAHLAGVSSLTVALVTPLTTGNHPLVHPPVMVGAGEVRNEEEESETKKKKRTEGGGNTD
jgi:hypothetical protein